jgi:4-amino-4-deoxy-L-arabinose transferase-like glycosyltransferase
LLAANPGTFGLARYAILDAPFTACLFGGAGLVIVSATKHRPRLEAGGYLLLALATCIKGPVAIALAGLAFVIASIVSREARHLLLGLRWIRGLWLVIALGLLWPLYMWWRFDDLFVQGYVLNENVRLFSESLYANQPGWWFYLGILIAGFLPWTGILLGRMSDAVRSAIGRRPPLDVVDVLLWSWTAAIVGFFSFSHFKLDHYIYPAAPSLCLLCARAWTDARSGQSAPGANIGVRAIGPLVALAGLAVGYLAIERLDLPPAFLVVPAALVVVGVASAVRYWLPERRGEFPVMGFVALAFVYAGVLIWVLPSLETGKVIPDVARWVAERASPGDRVVTFQLSRWNPTFRFYVDRPVAMLDADEEARRFFADPAPYYCVMTASRLATLEFLGVPMEVVYRRDGLWASSGQALWRRKGEPTTFVVTRPRMAARAP